jgi:hypothetical protein
MAKSAATLVSSLTGIGVFILEPPAILGWATSWTTYFSTAESNSISILPTILPAAQAAMVAAMTGLSSATDATPIQAGITAFWNALTPASAVFPGALSITPPPGLATMAADIILSATANVAASNSAAASYGIIVNGGGGGSLGLFSLDLTGAVAIFPPKVPFPIL